MYIHIRYYTISIFVNGLTFDYTAASLSGGIAPFLPENSVFLSDGPFDGRNTSGTGRNTRYPYLP